MKKNNTTAPGPENAIRLTPFTQKEMEARINGYDGPKPRMVEIARRNAFYDVEEAKAQAALRELEHSPASAKAIRQPMETKLAGITACRAIENIMDSLGNAWEERASALAPLKEAEDALTGMKAQAAAMESRLSDMRKRDMRAESNERQILEDEAARLPVVLEWGNWRHLPEEEKEDNITQELAALKDKGKYHGETTSKGAENRIAKIKKQLSDLSRREASALDNEEIMELEALKSQLEKINASIAADASILEATMETVASIESKFQELRETALVTVEGILEVHRIRTGTPGNPKTPASH